MVKLINFMCLVCFFFFLPQLNIFFKTLLKKVIIPCPVQRPETVFRPESRKAVCQLESLTLPSPLYMGSSLPTQASIQVEIYRCHVIRGSTLSTSLPSIIALLVGTWQNGILNRRLYRTQADQSVFSL